MGAIIQDQQDIFGFFATPQYTNLDISVCQFPLGDFVEDIIGISLGIIIAGKNCSIPMMLAAFIKATDVGRHPLSETNLIPFPRVFWGHSKLAARFVFALKGKVFSRPRINDCVQSLALVNCFLFQKVESMFGRVSYCLNVVAAFSVGYQYDEWRNLSNEIRQGGNYNLASLTQAAQILTIYWCTQKIFSRLISQIGSPYLRHPLKGLSLLGGISFSLILPFLALIKTGYYPYFYESLNVGAAKTQQGIYRLVARLLPSEFSLETIGKVGNFLDNFGTFADGAMVLNLVGLIAQNEKLYSAMILLGAVFNRLFRSHYIPLRIRLMTERYAPLFIQLSNLSNESWIAKIQGALSLGNRFLRLRVKVDEFVFQFLDVRLKTITLKTLAKYASFNKDLVQKTIENNKRLLRLVNVEEPFKMHKDLSFEEILATLTAKEIDFNPSHFSKSLGLDSVNIDLPEDGDFQQIERDFDSVDWKLCEETLLKKCKNDDRFILYLAEIFENKSLRITEVNQGYYRNNFEEFLKKIALQNEVLPLEFLLKWVKEQMKTFMRVLKSEKNFPGAAHEQEQFISNMKKIVHFLKQESLTRLDREDILLNLAIEGGRYCGIGLVDCSKGILKSLINSNLLKNPETPKSNEFSLFERSFYQKFEATRKALNLEGILFMMGLQSNGSTRSSALSTTDRHIYHLLKPPFSMGFSPLNPEEIDQFSLMQLLIFWFLRSTMVWHLLKFDMYLHSYYSLLEENRDFYAGITEYIVQFIEDNVNLNDWQKNFLKLTLQKAYKEEDFHLDYPDLKRPVIESLSRFYGEYCGSAYIETLLPYIVMNPEKYEKMKKTNPQKRKLEVLLGVIFGILKCPEVKKLA